jgi:hypothetical protein
MPLTNAEISRETFDRLLNESIGTVELRDSSLVDKSNIASHHTIPTTYTFSFPPGCA